MIEVIGLYIMLGLFGILILAGIIYAITSSLVITLIITGVIILSIYGVYLNYKEKEHKKKYYIESLEREKERLEKKESEEKERLRKKIIETTREEIKLLVEKMGVLISKHFNCLPCSKCGERKFYILRFSQNAMGMEIQCESCNKQLWVKSTSRNTVELAEIAKLKDDSIKARQSGILRLLESIFGNAPVEFGLIEEFVKSIDNLMEVKDDTVLAFLNSIFRNMLGPKELTELKDNLLTGIGGCSGRIYFVTSTELNSNRRELIPEAVRSEVWNRDDGQCVKCGSNENLEFDHIIPVSKGGANTVRNIQLLCEKCNRGKGASI